MLGTINKSITSQAVDTIGDIVVAYFTAIISTSGQMDVQMSIKNMDLYKENKAEVDSDYEIFKDSVFGIQ